MNQDCGKQLTVIKLRGYERMAINISRLPAQSGHGKTLSTVDATQTVDEAIKTRMKPVNILHALCKVEYVMSVIPCTVSVWSA